ncbi:hypothetical protein pdam_00024739 [Pocillopora damicornis]|uniref:Uncharacterized protein n=1 Tax=Pocillopora damicornis TaxID=46731 RepID=A0A3M6TEW2_POCDA|nr:hypothetical protein pdam_00024739 [Pocillopora damicornis]
MIVRTLKCLRNKNRKLKEFVYNRILPSIPKSSKLQCYIHMKTETNISNCCKFKLTKDIEKNPSPTLLYIDPNKTITAPYSQDSRNEY